MASSPDAMIEIDPQTNGEAATAATASTVPKSAGVLPTSVPAEANEPTTTMPDKVISSAANLAQLLPTGSVLAYQALAPSFTKHGDVCLSSNQWLTAVLVVVIASLSFFFSFTDSVVGPDRKLYYGVATPSGFNVFNFSSEEEKRLWTRRAHEKLRLRPLDFVHAFFTVVVFLTVVSSDVGLQNCLFPNASTNTKELLKNLPLGMAFLSSFVFTIFPTKRRGIGYSDATPHQNVT